MLTGDSGWYPRFGDGMLTFTLDIELPMGWHAISQGRRNASSVPMQAALTLNGRRGSRKTRYYLIAAPFTEYVSSDAGIEYLVYLRNDDRGACAALSGSHCALPADVPASHRPVPVRQVRTGGKFLGNRLWHAVVHAAGQPGDTPAVHRRYFLSP